MEQISHGFGPWEQVNNESPTARKKDFRVLTEKFDEHEGGLQSGRRLRRLNSCAKEESACESEHYEGLYSNANFRTVRIKYLNRAFSDG
jgi:hypothetical protein